jgi:hypothetical protein
MTCQFCLGQGFRPIVTMQLGEGRGGIGIPCDHKPLKRRRKRARRVKPMTADQVQPDSHFERAAQAQRRRQAFKVIADNDDPRPSNAPTPSLKVMR